MKTVSLLLTCLVFGGLHAYAQGTIGYNNRVTGSVDARIYAAETNELQYLKQGNDQTYSNGRLTGSQYRIQLWAGPAGTAESSLTLVPNSNRSFRTSTSTGAFGLIDTTPGPEIEIPGVLLGQQAALQLRVWDTKGGTITSWSEALNSITYVGYSKVFTSQTLGGGTTPAPNMEGLESFNVYLIPEPSTFVLAGLGGAAVLFLRRRK
jgi:hypothetical protein